MVEKLTINFEGFNKKWQEVMCELFENMDLKVKWKHEEDEMEITGTYRKIQNVREMLEMSDNGAIVE